MALEQTLFPIQRSVFQPGTVPALFSLGIQFQDESTSNGATPI